MNEQHAPDRDRQPDGGQSTTGQTATDDERTANEAPGLDEAEREVVTSGTAATSEIADRDAQIKAERQGDGTPLPG
ncbi:MAG TPA: hypothetical protein VM427_04000 [Patescibacteria group bacterium]|nr:hypothetical protein [Patescibacteria group bacterium]